GRECQPCPRSVIDHEGESVNPVPGASSTTRDSARLRVEVCTLDRQRATLLVESARPRPTECSTSTDRVRALDRETRALDRETRALDRQTRALDRHSATLPLVP